MKRLQTIAIALVAAAAAPAALAQTQSANSDTTFASHGDPQPAQNDPSQPAKKPTAHRRHQVKKASANGSMSTQSNQRPDLNNMTANTH